MNFDVMFARSTDNGQTWDEPVRVNGDISGNNWQWFGTMSVSPNGRIDVVWLDTRDSNQGYYSSLYYSYSIDGGQTFSMDERISEAFDPHVGWPQQDKMGDYFHMVSDDDYAHLAWANTLNGEQDVYYTRINPWFVGIDEDEINSEILLNVFPNPVKGQATVKYKLESRSDVHMGLYDMYGKEVASKTLQNAEPGSNTEQFITRALPNGIYFVKIIAGDNEATTKVIVSN